MANVSDAYGAMTLKGAWTPALIKTLNTIAAEIWAHWYYSIEIKPFDPKATPRERTTDFNGWGRWTFRLNLENLGDWTLDSLHSTSDFTTAVLNKLIQAMHDKGLIIEIEYTDEEGGCEVHYDETGEISSNGEKFVYVVTKHTALPPKKH